MFLLRVCTVGPSLQHTSGRQNGVNNLVGKIGCLDTLIVWSPYFPTCLWKTCRSCWGHRADGAARLKACLSLRFEPATNDGWRKRNQWVAFGGGAVAEGFGTSDGTAPAFLQGVVSNGGRRAHGFFDVPRFEQALTCVAA